MKCGRYVTLAALAAGLAFGPEARALQQSELELLATGAIVESPVTIDQFRNAPRFWLINSVRGWCPAVMAASDSL